MMNTENINSILMRASSNRVGAPVATTSSERRLLQEIGVIGPDGGLTRQGTIARERAMRAAEDAAFS